MSTQPSQELVPAGQGGALVRPQRTIKDLLQGPELKAAVQAALPKHLTVERFLRVAINATMRQPQLLQCNRESFFRALMDLSAYGLEPDGRRAHLIPFGKEVQLIIDYKGLAELVRRSGDVSYIHADVVYEGDVFDFSYGSGAFLKHRPNLEKRGTQDAGRRVAFYSFVRLKDGSEDFVVLGPGEVEAVRKTSKAANKGPWAQSPQTYDEMGKKTAFRRHSKWLPLSPEVKDAVERDDEFTGIDIGEAISAAANHATVSVDDFQPSADENRGHDATAPAAAGNPSPAPPSKEKIEQGLDKALANNRTTAEPVPEVDELPDPLSTERPLLYHKGVLYEKNDPENPTAWRPMNPQPAPAQKASEQPKTEQATQQTQKSTKLQFGGGKRG